MSDAFVVGGPLRGTRRGILQYSWGVGALRFVEVEETTFELWVNKLGTSVAFEILLLCVASGNRPRIN